MKRLLKRVFGHIEEPEITVDDADTSSPVPGQIYSFQTRSYSEYAAKETNRFAAIKVIGTDEKIVAVAVLTGIWPVAPTASDIRGQAILNEHRFSHTGRAAVFGVNRSWWNPEADLDRFSFVGSVRLSQSEQAQARAILSFAVGTRHSTINAANYAAEGEWRWANDREALVLEAEKKDAKNKAERAAKEERYRTRLSRLTWDQLRAEIPFERWTPSPPFPPEEFTNAARATIRDACEALEALGTKPRKAEVRAILKKAVAWFNNADEKAGGVIETEEREDICAVLEEMAHVARQKSLVEEIDEWREW